MISFNKKSKTYNVFLNNKYFVSYTVSRHGEFAKLLAEKSNETHKKYHNYYDIDTENNCARLYIHSKVHGDTTVKLKIEDIEDILDISWYMTKHKNESIYIISAVGPLGRILLNLNDHNKVITFQDEDHLNYTRENLIVLTRTERYAQEVLKINSDENLVWKNVREHHIGSINRFRIIYFTIENDKHIRKCKDIYFRDNNYYEKLDIAIQFSIRKRFENAYVLTENDLSYIKDTNMIL